MCAVNSVNHIPYIQKPAADGVHQQLYCSIIYHYGLFESSNSRSTAILPSNDLLDSTGSDFGITPLSQGAT